jgi:hypothetical protein
LPIGVSLALADLGFGFSAVVQPPVKVDVLAGSIFSGGAWRASSKWRNKFCPQIEAMTEFDYMRFLTRANTLFTTTLSMTDFRDVYWQACAGTGNTPRICGSGDQVTWTGAKGLDTAAITKFGQFSGKYTQWRDRALETGVDSNLTP